MVSSAPTANIEHGIVPDSTPPPSPTSNQENTISVEVPIAPAPVTESVQVMVSKAPQTAAVSPRIQLSLAHDGSVLVHPPGSTLSSMPAPAPSPGLVATTQLGQPQSFVTLHGTAVANMLCHGANNARINHIVVSPSAPSAVVPTTTTTAVMASSQAVVGRTATAVPTSMAHTVVTMATCPTVTSVTVTPTVVVTTSNSSATAHGSGKCTAPMNSQNQQLYEQLQSQITYLNSLKKPTMQQKLLLHQMLAIEEKLRDSSKPLRSSQARNLALITAVPTSHAHCMQRHEVKPTVVSHPMPAAATIITAKPSAVTTVQVPTIAVTTTTRTTSRTTHHKVNHADVKPKASILHAGNAASIISTQKAVTSHPQMLNSV
ncbi:hypothetical protein HPB52_009603 [Rhipicephalus sanguineus]|uniref:Uncharacterized protein n=1 Tax=Rhipicephalus sanguineus TaxID=34632 RepID=A0A9D4PCM1_RHISA|nr:hypothetical protein HPB52_009603 [Rhipicephalus sanguineus]